MKYHPQIWFNLRKIFKLSNTLEFDWKSTFFLLANIQESYSKKCNTQEAKTKIQESPKQHLLREETQALKLLCSASAGWSYSHGQNVCLPELYYHLYSNRWTCQPKAVGTNVVLKQPLLFCFVSFHHMLNLTAEICSLSDTRAFVRFNTHAGR